MKAALILPILLLLMLTSGPTGAAGGSLIIGVAPHTSARVILEMYQPLRQHLEKSLNMTVEIVTAPDFDTFARRGLAQEFDLAITTGHQARLFQVDAQYIPLLTYKAEFTAVALTKTSGPIHKPSDLNGKQVLGLSPVSQVTIWGMHWLKENRINTAPIRYVSASDSVAQLIISGEAVAGFTSMTNYLKLPPDVKTHLRVLAESKPMAGRVYVLNSRQAALQKKLQAALWDFAATPEAKKYFMSNNLEGYRKLRPDELKSMDPYTGEVRKILNSGAQ